MLDRAWGFMVAPVVVAVACGGSAFESHPGDGMSGSAGTAMDLAGAAGSEPRAGSSGAASGGAGGALPTSAAGTAGAAGMAGASSGGAPATAPSIEIVQASRTGIVGNADPSLTLSAPPAAGNALIVGISCFSDFENCVIPEGGVTDNQGNDYALVIEGSSIVSSDTHGTRPYLFIAENIGAAVGSLTVSVNPNGTPPENYQNFAWGVLEVSGLLAENSLDQTGSFPNSCCDPSTTVSTDAATQQSNELVVAVHSARSNDNDFNYGYEPDWVQHHVNNDGVSLASQHSLVTRIVTDAGAISHTWTHDEPTRGVAAIIATFRGAAP